MPSYVGQKSGLLYFFVLFDFIADDEKGERGKKWYKIAFREKTSQKFCELWAEWPQFRCVRREKKLIQMLREMNSFSISGRHMMLSASADYL